MNKPDVLSDEEIGKALTIDFKATTGKDPKEYFSYISENDRVIAQAQLDAAVAHYEPLIQQARAEVAREIFEEIEERAFKPPSRLIIIGPGSWQFLKSKYTEGKWKK